MNASSSKPRNILSLSSDEKRKFLDSFDHVFADIDGVIWNIVETISGADAGLRALHDAGKQITLVTNNAVRPEDRCLKRLKENNIDIEAKNLMNPAKTISEYLKSINFKGLIYIIASEYFRNVLKNEGFELLYGPDGIINESFQELSAHVVAREPVKAVIIDFDFNLTLTKMMKAHFYLRKPDCLLIGGAVDMTLSVSQNLTFLGPGGFLKILQETCGQEMLFFGKPGKALGDTLMHRSNIKEANRVLMIGDMLDTDVRFGHNCGFQTLLVLSGGTKLANMLANTDPNETPKYYANSLLDFVEFIEDLKKSHA